MFSVARSSAAFALSVLFCAGAVSESPLPGPVAADVHESYRLLTSSYYDAVDPQALLAAASDALVEAAKKHGAAIDPPLIHAQSPDTMAELDAAIASSAEEAHAAPTEFAYVAIDAMAHAVGDRYTQFFTPDEFRAFNDALDPEKISGIGVMIVADEPSSSVRLSYVVPGTPADRAGLHVGDVLVSIDGSPTKGMAVENASRLLRGKAGTLVALAVQRAGTPQSLAFSIKREEVQPPTVVFRMLPNNIGYVYVMAFGKGTPSEFDTAIGRLKENGARALVLDLRNDGGGYVDSALTISSRFIANKPLVTVEERGRRATTIDADNQASIDLPVTVLVNGYTASASEITAGALQDDGIAELIGTKTYGKGVMQTLTPLPDGAAIKITTAHYLTPRHRDINLRGIDPDVLVNEPRDARPGDAERDAQLHAALLLLQRKIAAAKP
ncbi:MAG: S41 family peptidase [Candidatus Eremiobacteraeota bacterium]|nr:S41 family peptidase [Candidatus Eremiobacteraeota bacterium]